MPGCILVVDDLPDPRSTVQGILEDAGYVVRSAANKEEEGPRRYLAHLDLPRPARGQLPRRARSRSMPSSERSMPLSSQISMHESHTMQRFLYHCTSVRTFRLSGLWHQAKRSGQPLKNTVVRMPGPSSVDSLCRCRIRPCISSLMLAARRCASPGQ